MNEIILISSCFYVFSMCVVFWFVARHSKLYIYFLSIEYFYLLGLGVYPILLVFGVVGFPGRYSNYSVLADISIFTPFSILFYGLGGFLGALVGEFSNFWDAKLIHLSRVFYIHPRRLVLIFSVLVLLSFGALVCFFGFYDVISTASLRRAGDFDFNKGLGRLAFLTRFSTLGLFVVAAYPYFIIRGEKLFKYTVVIYLIGLVAYAETLSRHAIFQTFILTGLIYWAYNKRKISVYIFLSLLFVAGLGVLLYGKVLIPYLTMSSMSGASDGIYFHTTFDQVMISFGNTFYSIDAGIRNFLHSGLMVFKDVLLAPLGVLPSSLFRSIGLSQLSYQLVSPAKLASCVNSGILGVKGECSVPPYYTGVASYICPVAGAFVFGFARFWLYILFSKSWERLEFEVNGAQYISTLLLIFLSVFGCMLFIPSSISLVVFLWIVIVAVKAVIYFISALSIPKDRL